MDVDIRDSDTYSDAERACLMDWGEDVFGMKRFAIEWRPKDRHLTAYAGDRPVSHVGLLSHTARVGEKDLVLGGIGGVITLPEFQGQGIATRLLGRGEEVMRDEYGAEHALLFCRSELLAFYAALGWKHLETRVQIEQAGGETEFPLECMTFSLRGGEWPAGKIVLGSLPW